MFENILVTGGAGFAGSAISLTLKRVMPDARVCALDNLRRRGSELNLERLRAGRVDFVHGDVRSLEDLIDLGHSPDLIIECSAEASAQAGYQGGSEFLVRTNLLGVFHCLELARRSKAAILFVSTSRVYPFTLLNDLHYQENHSRFTLSATQSLPGASEKGISEAFPLSGPRSLYGMTKLAAELMVEEYGNAFGLPYIINRCGLLTGPWQMARSDQGVIALWLAAHYFRRPLSYIGFGATGKQVRDFLHIEDFCDLIVDQVRNFSRYAGGPWNVGGGVENSLSLCEATKLCREITGNEISIPGIAENRPADVRIYLTDHRNVTSINGWSPSRKVNQTLADIFAWLQKEECRLRDII